MVESARLASALGSLYTSRARCATRAFRRDAFWGRGARVPVLRTGGGVPCLCRGSLRR